MIGTAPVASAIVSRFVAIPPWPETRRRLPRLVIGLVLCGVAFALIVRAELGLDPWDVFHQGVSELTGVPIGTVSVITGLVILLGWIPLRERIGLGTILNALIIGTVMDLVIPRLPAADGLPIRWGMLAAGLIVSGPGIGMYIGARLGPGPRDGIMTGIAQRGTSIRLARTMIELAALLAGLALGGTVGIGTILFALTVGPNVHHWLERLDLGHPPGFEPRIDPVVDPDPTITGA